MFRRLQVDQDWSQRFWHAGKEGRKGLNYEHNAEENDANAAELPATEQALGHSLLPKQRGSSTLHSAEVSMVQQNSQALMCRCVQSFMEESS